MIRLIVRLGILLVANAVGLLVASQLLDGMDMTAGGFLIAVAIFTVAMALALPFLASVLRRRRSAALGGVALIATLAALIVTTIVSDSLSISGVGTWVAAAVIVWAVSLLAGVVLPLLGLKRFLEERQ